MFVAVGIFVDRTRHHFEVGFEPTNADLHTGSVITVVSKAKPGVLAVVLHGQGTALPTLVIFGGDIFPLLYQT